ncbi:class I SAM-dependent methyltransferase [Dendronalium sp. ChiSLP03b]|uniref:class I SAM-dependent methyltransferase n=1 Tax=Dendronalium sp. ChiSLP03b TaxID=3075381 RepID=UPI002AD1EF8B|nr:class I SAM-dependent methyltransferase [Dendronalium sp. ChiSLP03b]MDZ8206528.1 class I SAM-dependent methyltransferase [Dendronalium sp. ChiSLP03b]
MELSTEIERLELNDIKNASQFYNNRYEGDYMDEWPTRKKRRVYELLLELGLPEEGIALDFGCGTGVFTSVIKQAFPRWQVCGTDLSSVALEKAKAKNPNCDFFRLDDPTLIYCKFDFIFSHHVLEHVSDIDETWILLSQLSKPGTRMLHICPCGNEGSFEHNLCRLKKNGLRQHPKNTFFYEDRGHLRRLDTQQMRSLAAKYGFDVCLEYYAWHHYEAIEGIIEEGLDYVRYLTDPIQAANDAAQNKLHRLRKQLQTIAMLRTLTDIVNRRQQKPEKSWKDYAVIAILKPLTAIPWLTSRILKWLADNEWHQRRKDPKGAEMYFLFKLSEC